MAASKSILIASSVDAAIRDMPSCCNYDPLATKTIADCVFAARIELDLYEEQQDGCCSKREASQLKRYLRKWTPISGVKFK